MKPLVLLTAIASLAVAEVKLPEKENFQLSLLAGQSNMAGRGKLAMEKGTLKAILWHQGESDSNKNKASRYEKNLEELILRFRKDLGQPDLPFIIGQLGVFPGKESPGKESNPNRETVNKAFESLSQKTDNVTYVTSEGLTSHDGIHFGTKSARIFAERYAATYMEMTARKP